MISDSVAADPIDALFAEILHKYRFRGTYFSMVRSISRDGCAAPWTTRVIVAPLGSGNGH